VGYLLGLVVAFLLFLSLYYFSEIAIKQKVMIVFGFLFLVFGAVAFNSYSESQRIKMMNVVNKFNQHKSIKCGLVEVNSSKYTLSIGTYTFIGKKGTDVDAQMISASSCN
jgi:uncharacterized protein YacL